MRDIAGPCPVAVSDFAWATSIARVRQAGSRGGTYFVLLLLLLQVSGYLRYALAHAVRSWLLTSLESDCDFGSGAALGFEVVHKESIAPATELRGLRSREVHRSSADRSSGVSQGLGGQLVAAIVLLAERPVVCRNLRRLDTAEPDSNGTVQGTDSAVSACTVAL